MDQPRALQDRIAAFDGEIHLMVRTFDGREFCHNSDAPTDPMSVMKLAYLYEAFRTLDMTEMVTIEHDDKAFGTGILMRLTGGVTLSMMDVATLMIVLSDNVATDFILGRLDREGMAERLKEMGLKNTFAAHGFGSSYAPDCDRQNTTTPRDIITLLEHIRRDETMMSILAKQQDRTIIHHFLPDDVKRYTKSGQKGEIRNDVGIVEWNGGGACIALFGIRKTPAGNVRGLLEYDMQLAPIAEAAYLWARETQ